MRCHCGTNNRAPRWTFTDPCKPEVRPGAREESASPAWLAAPAMNARDTTNLFCNLHFNSLKQARTVLSKTKTKRIHGTNFITQTYVKTRRHGAAHYN